MDKIGSCEGSCTHVWNYEVATPFLFGNLAQTMRDVEFNYATKENGLMNFRADLPLSEAAKRSSEYCAATGMIYEGQNDNALTCIKAISDRFDGEKRSPFDEPECGHHYARAMASWSSIIALSEFQYSGVTKSMTITSKPGTYFWSNGYAWGLCTVTNNGVTVKVLKGNLELKSFTLKGKETKRLKNICIGEGENKMI